MRQLWLLFACAAAILTWGLPGLAQVSLQLSAGRIEVGSAVQVKLSATGSQSPHSPQLELPPDVSGVGPSIGTSHQVSIVNGRVQRSVGINATWQLTPTKEGEYTIGPASVVLEGQTLRSNTVRLTVVAKGTLPRNPARRRGLPFDDDLLPGFPGGGRSLFDDLFGTPGWHAPPQAPPEYQLDRAPDPAAFLRAVAKPRSVVVGQQVTLEIFAYGGLGRFNESPGQTREPRTQDFYAVPLREPGQRQQLYPVTIDGREYLAVKMRELALFPLKSGELTVGPMQMGFYGSRYLTGRNQLGLLRQSNELRIKVSDPPIAGRPSNYRIGDVGDFTLRAEVSNRELRAGESISVEAQISGHGNFPLELDLPQQNGVEWLQPTAREAIAPDEGGRIAGTKTFTYIVKLTEPGNIDLGAIKLPFYHPPSASYRTARAALGEVVVHPNASPAPSSTAGANVVEEARLSELGQPRSHLRQAPSRHYLAERVWYWGFLLFAPSLVLLVGWLQGLAREWGQRRRQSQKAWQRQVASELATAKQALGQDPDANIDANLERALFGAIEGATTIRGRGLLRSELEGALVAAGVSSAVSKEVVALLQAFEEGRFGARSAPPRELLERTRKLVHQLKRASSPTTARREVAA